MKCPQCHDSSKLLLERKVADTHYYSVSEGGRVMFKSVYGNRVSEVLLCTGCGKSDIPFVKVDDGCIAEKLTGEGRCSCYTERLREKGEVVGTSGYMCVCGTASSDSKKGGGVRVWVAQENKATLLKYRERLLKTVGMSSVAEFTQIAKQRKLTEKEEAVAYQLKNIAFLLGEKC